MLSLTSDSWPLQPECRTVLGLSPILQGQVDYQQVGGGPSERSNCSCCSGCDPLLSKSEVRCQMYLGTHGPLGALIHPGGIIPIESTKGKHHLDKGICTGRTPHAEFRDSKFRVGERETIANVVDCQGANSGCELHLLSNPLHSYNLCAGLWWVNGTPGCDCGHCQWVELSRLSTLQSYDSANLFILSLVVGRFRYQWHRKILPAIGTLPCPTALET